MGETGGGEEGTRLAGGVAHVIDLALGRGGVAKAPVLWLKPLVAAICQHLPTLHAPLRASTSTSFHHPHSTDLYDLVF